MMKKTIEQAVIAYRILNEAKLGKMKDGDKFSAVKIMKGLKGVATSYDDFLKDASEKLKPEGFAEIQGKENPTPDEKKVLEKYQQDINECVSEELKKEVELDFTPLSEEGMKGIMESNDFTMGQIMALYEVIAQ